MPTITKQLTITAEDRPGLVAKAAEAIGKAGINIEGHAAMTTGGQGILNLITSDPPGARRALEGAGFTVKEERDAVILETENRPGTLAKALRQIADAGVNLDFTYSLVANRVVVGSKDFGKLRDAVRAEQPAGARR
jgi:hypothetical protein